MSRVGQITEDEIREQWPLHWLVWTDSPNPLDRLLAEKQVSCHVMSVAEEITSSIIV